MVLAFFGCKIVSSKNLLDVAMAKPPGQMDLGSAPKLNSHIYV